MCLPGLPDLCVSSLVSFYGPTNTDVYDPDIFLNFKLYNYKL